MSKTMTTNLMRMSPPRKTNVQALFTGHVVLAARATRASQRHDFDNDYGAIAASTRNNNDCLVVTPIDAELATNIHDAVTKAFLKVEEQQRDQVIAEALQRERQYITKASVVALVEDPPACFCGLSRKTALLTASLLLVLVAVGAISGVVLGKEEVFAPLAICVCLARRSLPAGWL
jgi:hypothetical protein